MKKIFTFMIATVVFLIHLNGTILYLSPKNPLSYWYQPFIFWYMDPFFLQSWSLFAPEPALSSLKIIYSCTHHQSTHKELSSVLIKNHQMNRLSADGILARIISGAAGKTNNLLIEETRKCELKNKECYLKSIKEIQKKDVFIALYSLIENLCEGYTVSNIKIIHYYPADFSKHGTSENGPSKVQVIPIYEKI